MKSRINQQQNGYVTVVTLAFIIGIVVTMTFVLEIGRMIATDATAENAVDLAVRAGVYAYGETFEEEMKKAYKKSEEEVDEELAALGVTLPEDEYKAEVKKKLKEKVPAIKQKSASTCKDTSKQILEANKATLISVACNEERVIVTGKVRYQSVFSETQLGSGDLERSRTQKIQVQIE